jgi:hypothetical protein
MIRQDKGKEENTGDLEVRMFRITTNAKRKDIANMNILIRKIRYAEKYNNRKALYEILDTYNGSKKKAPKSFEEFKTELSHISNILICKN